VFRDDEPPPLPLQGVSKPPSARWSGVHLRNQARLEPAHTAFVHTVCRRDESPLVHGTRYPAAEPKPRVSTGPAQRRTRRLGKHDGRNRGGGSGAWDRLGRPRGARGAPSSPGEAAKVARPRDGACLRGRSGSDMRRLGGQTRTTKTLGWAARSRLQKRLATTPVAPRIPNPDFRHGILP